MSSQVVSVSPFRCKAWEHHGRLDEYITEESCRAEISSFLTHGQQYPVLGRRLVDDPDFDFEIVCGARRLFVARHLSIELRVEIRTFSNRQSAIALEIDNSQRTFLSAYERGRSFARWLAEGYFVSQDDLGRALCISPSQVSKLLKIGRLPSVILNAFTSPTDICEVWGIALFDMWERPELKISLAAKARRLAKITPRPPSARIYELLTHSDLPSNSVRATPKDEIVLDASGRPLFRVKRHRDSVAIVVSSTRITGKLLDQLKLAMLNILQDEKQGVSRQTRLSRTPSVDVSPLEYRAQLGSTEQSTPAMM